MRLKGKVALVTGSSQGIGQGIVLRLAEEGAKVVINYRSHPEGAQETLAKVEAAGGQCYAARCSQSQGYTIQANLGNVEEVQQLIAESIEHFGQLDVLVNNAGIEMGITINNVAPGAIETPINAKLISDSDKLSALLHKIPLGRLGKPQDVASLVAFLASSDADYITGATFFVDGGLLWSYQEQ